MGGQRFNPESRLAATRVDGAIVLTGSVVAEGMPEALLIGGTRFIGRHTVTEFRENGYEVTLFNRGNHENPFESDPAIDHIEGDRENESALEAAAESVDPDVVVDLVAYKPRDVETATRIFEDVDAYVYISSGSAYGAEVIPKREDESPLHECTQEQAVDDSSSSYGPRKAEGDRTVFRAADRGVSAMAIRPPVVYGPHDYTDRLAYWLDRVNSHDRVLVPGDGTNIWHRVYVKDVASAIRVIAESGSPGEAYNVGDRDIPTLAEMVELIAEVSETDVELVPASERELSVADLSLDDFPLYRDPPHVLSTEKLASLGWDATPLEASMAETVAAFREREDPEIDPGPDRETEERVLQVLDTL